MSDEEMGMPAVEPDVDAVEVEFRREAAELAPQLEGDTYWDAVWGLRSVEESGARHLLGVGADAQNLTRQVQRRGRALSPRAGPHPSERGEEWQWHIGPSATGRAEWLASVAQVRRLQACQAWLHGGIARHLGARGTPHGAEARRLMGQVRNDPYGMGRQEEKSLRELDQFLAALER